MADPADAAEEHAGLRQIPELAAMMSAFSMFPQEEAPPAAPSTQPSPPGRSLWDDTFRQMIVPANAPPPEAKPRPSAARFGAIGTWQLSASPIAMPPPPAPMKVAAPAPELAKPVAAPPEPEPTVTEPETVPEPEPPIAVQSPPERRAEPEWIAPLQHAPEPELLPLYAQVSDKVAQVLAHAEPVPPPLIAAVLFDPAERLDRSPAPAGRPLFARLIVWQLATAASLALALVAGVVAFAPHGAAPLTSVAAIGVVNAPAPLYLAEIDSAAVLRLTALATIAVPNGRDLQLWIIPQGEQIPTSLGVLPSRGTVVTLPAVPPEGTRFIISMEPRGGTTGGRITGQVLYGGTLAHR